LSELGLIYKINKEVLHPLGLALSRNKDGTSNSIFIDTKDFKFEYSEDVIERNEKKYNNFLKNRINILKKLS